MKVVSVVWAVIVDLVIVVVVLAMFRAATSPFEVVVVSGLTLIYTSVENSVRLLANFMLDGRQIRAAQFVEIIALLNHPNIEDYRVAVKESSDERENMQVKFYIRVCFTTLVSIIAVWNLVKALA